MAKEYKFVPERGTARITSDLNVRKGAPTGMVDVVRVLHAGATQTYIGYVVDGDRVAEISKWFLTSEGDFFWCGNTDTVNVSVLGRILARPLDALVCTQRFGERPHVYAGWGSPKGHNGLDFRTRKPETLSDWKQPVYAVLEGTVSDAGENALIGKYVRLAHPNGYESVYLHLSDMQVTKGQQVTTRARIGTSGNSGSASEAPHLHFGFRPQKYDKDNGHMGYIDPLPYFKDEVRFV